jgi:hypothetical protein
MTLDDLIASLQALRSNSIAGRFPVELDLGGLDDEALVVLDSAERDDHTGVVTLGCTVIWD